MSTASITTVFTPVIEVSVCARIGSY